MSGSNSRQHKKKVIVKILPFLTNLCKTYNYILDKLKTISIKQAFVA